VTPRSCPASSRPQPVLRDDSPTLAHGEVQSGCALRIARPAVASRAYVLEKGELTYAGPAAALAQQAGFVESSYLGSGAQRPQYERVRAPTTEMLRVRVDPALVRRMREAGHGRPIPEMANDALERYVAELEGPQPHNGRQQTRQQTGGVQ